MSFQRNSSSGLIRNALSPFLRRSKLNERSSLLLATDLSKLIVSTTEIRFQCRGGHNQYLYNRELRLTNHTGTKISFKIKSNNPEHYEVIPCQQSLDEGKSCEVRIRVSISSHNVSKYNLDRFALLWGVYQPIPSHVVYSESRHLKVQVEVENLSQEMTQNRDKEEKDIAVYEELIKKNRAKIKELKEIIEKKENEPMVFVVSKGMMFSLALLSFILAYIIM